MLRGDHQLGFVFASPFVHEPHQDVTRRVVREPGKRQGRAVRVVQDGLFQVVVRARALVGGADGSGPARGERSAVLDAGRDTLHEDTLEGRSFALAAQVRVGDVRDAAVGVVAGVAVLRVGFGVDGVERARVRVEEDAARRAPRVADPRVAVLDLDVDLGLGGQVVRGHLHARGEGLAPAEQIAPEVIGVGDERAQPALLQALGADAAAAGETRARFLGDVHDGVHQERARFAVAPRVPRDVGVLQTRGVDEVVQVVQHAPVERLPGLDVFQVPRDVLRPRRARAGFARLAVDEADLDVPDPGFLDAQLQDAVAHLDAVPLHRDLLLVVPLGDLGACRDEQRRVEELAKLRLEERLGVRSRELVASFDDDASNHRVRGEFEREAYAVPRVHRLGPHLAEHARVEHAHHVRFDLLHRVREVGLDAHHRARELLQLGGLALEVHGADQNRTRVLLAAALGNLRVARDGRRAVAARLANVHPDVVGGRGGGVVVGDEPDAAGALRGGVHQSLGARPVGRVGGVGAAAGPGRGGDARHARRVGAPGHAKTSSHPFPRRDRFFESSARVVARGRDRRREARGRGGALAARGRHDVRVSRERGRL